MRPAARKSLGEIMNPRLMLQSAPRRVLAFLRVESTGVESCSSTPTGANTNPDGQSSSVSSLDHRPAAGKSRQGLDSQPHKGYIVRPSCDRRHCQSL
jgi:hypothetical protein